MKNAQLWLGLIPVLVPLAIALLKLIAPKVPRPLLPILAPILGGLADAAIAWAAGSPSNPILGAALGSAGVGLREIVDQLRPGQSAQRRAPGVGSGTLYALLFALIVSGCATTGQNPFSAKAVIQFDQASFFVTYLKTSQAYVVARYQVTQLCASGAIPEATCAELRVADDRIELIANDINTSLQNPLYPIDMAKVQAFIGEVLTILVKVGVKGVVP